MKHRNGLLFWVKDTLLAALIKAYIHGALIHRERANAFLRLLNRLIHSPIEICALPLVWMDEATPEKGLLRHGSMGVTYRPHYIGLVQSTECVRLPDIHYYVFERARVSVTSSSVILNDKQVIIDRAIGPDQSKYDYAGGHIVAHGGDTAVVRLGKPENIEKGIY